MSPVTIANYGKIQINKQEPYSKISIQCFRDGDMDVASLLSTTGMLCLSNKGFLLLFILKK
ncbi:hypothetical protein DKE41_008465 [Acinetobacter pittii]|nr:hypothetical protein DKE41_008465 [Acinetobacter pittii]